jgi:hypothetical protein
MLKNAVKRSIFSLRGFVDFVTGTETVPVVPVDGKIKYDMVINWVDDEGDKASSRRTYKTALSRQIAAQRLAEESIIEIDDDETDYAEKTGITGLVFDDRLIFWRKSPQTPELPARVPPFNGDGEYVLRCLTKSGFIECTGLSYNRLRKTIESASQKLDTVPVEAAVIRRRVAYKRKLVLSPVD